MEDPRRPPDDANGEPRPRDPGPVSWSRRLDEAREVRARILAERARGGPEAEAPAAGPAPAPSAPPPQRAGPPPVPAGRRRLPWRVLGGFVAGSAAGAVAVALLLAGAPDEGAVVPAPPTGAIPAEAGPEPPAPTPSAQSGEAGAAPPTIADPAEAGPEPSRPAMPPPVPRSGEAAAPPAAAAPVEAGPAPPSLQPEPAEPATPDPLAGEPVAAPQDASDPSPPELVLPGDGALPSRLEPSAADLARDAARRAMAQGGPAAPAVPGAAVLEPAAGTDAAAPVSRIAEAPDPEPRGAPVAGESMPGSAAGMDPVARADAGDLPPEDGQPGEGAAVQATSEPGAAPGEGAGVQAAPDAGAAPDEPAAVQAEAAGDEPGAASNGPVGAEDGTAVDGDAGVPASPGDAGTVTGGLDAGASGEAGAGEAAPPAGPVIAPEARPEALAGAVGDEGPGLAEAPVPLAAGDTPAGPDAPAVAEAQSGTEAPAEARAAAEAAEEGDRPPGAARALVLVHAPSGVSEEALVAAVAGLTAEGYRIGDIVRVDLRISRTNVRYFHPGDAEIAEGVAEALAGVARDFTSYRPSPEPGTIEVWLEG